MVQIQERLDSPFKVRGQWVGKCPVEWLKRSFLLISLDTITMFVVVKALFAALLLQGGSEPSYRGWDGRKLHSCQVNSASTFILPLMLSMYNACFLDSLFESCKRF